jgi:4-amino-4-deoxy-L-arabinose transferase-like glycosyltransferase
MGGMKQSLALEIFDRSIPFVFGIGLLLLAPLGTALQLGADEGYELMKGWLVSLGYPLYTEIWNDQPPLHTELLAAVFGLFGPSALAGRLLSIGFAMILVASLYQLVKLEFGRVASILSIVLLVSSSYFLQLSVSVMLELPAMALGLASLCSLANYISCRRRLWLIAAGVLYGCALQIKFTAAIFLPAIIAACLVGDPASKGRLLALNLGAAFVTFVIILLAFCPLDAFLVFWRSHVTPKAADVAGYAWRPSSLLEDVPLLAGSAAALAFAFWKRPRAMLPPIILLATVVAIHSWHRPHWNYYTIHFTIPMAWLGGVGIVEWFKLLWRRNWPATTIARLRFRVCLLLWSAVLSMVLAWLPELFPREIGRIKAALLPPNTPPSPPFASGPAKPGGFLPRIASWRFGPGFQSLRNWRLSPPNAFGPAKAPPPKFFKSSNDTSPNSSS